MNEDIKQLIEKEAREEYLEYLHGTSNEKEFLDMDDVIPLHDAVKACEITANFILSKWQEADRWRKVEEELPDKDGMYLVTTEKSLYVIAEYLGGFWVLDVKKCGAILRWKPIND